MSTFCERVLVVVGCRAARVAARIPSHVEVVVNDRWQHSHPIDSLAVALAHLATRLPCLVTPVDTPPVRSATATALLRHVGGRAVPVGPDGRRGHPVLLDPATCERIAARPPAGGLREVLGDATEVEVQDPTVSIDFDRPDEWAAFASRWTPERGMIRSLSQLNG